MILIPDSALTKNDVNILGIDPGTDTIGFAIIKVNLDDLNIISVRAWTESLSRLIDETSALTLVRGNRFNRLNTLRTRLQAILETFNPIVVAAEAPFYSRRTASAYAPLVETLYTIHQAIQSWDDFKPLYLFDPPTVKKSVGVQGKPNKKKGETTKTVVKAAITKVKELKLDYDLLDEHSIDAIAVAYCKLIKLRAEL